MDHELFRDQQRALINHRWRTATPEERIAVNQRMLEGKKRKAAERAAARGEGSPPPDPPKPAKPKDPPNSHLKSKTNPLLPIGVIPTPAPVPITYPPVSQVLGGSIEKLARECVDKQPDAASLDHYERELRLVDESQKLCIRYYELTGQIDKVMLWTAQLRKSLEQRTKPQREVASHKNREDREALEAENARLSEQIAEAEVDAMTDAELEAAVKAMPSDITVDNTGDDTGIAEMTVAELKAANARMRAELDRLEAECPVVATAAQVEHDAGVGGVTNICKPTEQPMAEPDIEPYPGADDYWPVEEAEPEPVHAARCEIAPEPAVRLSAKPAVTAGEFTPGRGRRDPFY